MKLYLTWELGVRGKPSPALYHDEPPPQTRQYGSPVIVSGPFQLSEEDFMEWQKTQGFPTWLIEKYPPPVLTD